MIREKSTIKVGIADLNFVESPDTIRTSGLGSCVGVIIYDVSKQMAGLAHIMLPDSNLSKQKNLNIYKYADTAIDYLYEQLLSQGASKYQLKAKVAGGAQMFPNQLTSEVMRIGPRNVEAITEQLKKYRIPIVASDVGGSSGRTIDFDPATSNLTIRTVNEGEKII
ncbi:MAG TPA: chemotaxis protein CheD [Pseudogracilibacillus sp.]|nr:chemotaxis protein CheD [Pseudogracilibacillus sp.]